MEIGQTELNGSMEERGSFCCEWTLMRRTEFESPSEISLYCVLYIVERMDDREVIVKDLEGMVMVSYNYYPGNCLEWLRKYTENLLKWSVFQPNFGGLLPEYAGHGDLKHELSSITRALRSWVRIPLKAWMSAFILCLCCPVCRSRPCNGLVTLRRSQTDWV
jgi:hypothetical protein